ncbi:hypothetical protein IV203_008041 [Nitzschia inconspicua]|uniref:Uncharacterized protein n=1 Tax=Nitzschia inconspicua TaxID=303405 RepID=A0A9K3KZD0_9STRA|nr:hypothetical protein IV203_008041 [Nitzschia inconspicua]
MGSQQSLHQNHGVDSRADTPGGLPNRKRKRETSEDVSTTSNIAERTPGIHGDNVEKEENLSTPSSSLSESRDYAISPQRRKRRRLSSRSLPPVFSRLWEVLNDRTAFWFSKYCFLNFLEMATARAKRTDFDSEDDVRNSILTMLDYFQKQDLDILRRGWSALSIVVGCPQRPGQLPARESGLEEDAAIISMVMQQCSDNDMIQLLGCRALRVLVCGGDRSQNASESESNDWNALHQAGVLSALTNAIRFCTEERTVQGLCVSFVAMLIKEVGEPVKQDLLHKGGVAIILQACRHWQRDAGVLHTLLCVLYQLTTRSTRQSLIDNGAITLLSCCINVHRDNKEIVELILGTMNQLSIVSETIFAGQSLVPKILALLEKYPDNETVQFFGMVLLRAAGRSDPIPLQLAAKQVVAAFKSFPDTNGVLFFSCALIWQLLQFHNNDQNEALTLLSSNGALDLVIDAVHRHNDVYGLGAVAHLILTYAWENRPMENEAATQAFGGSEDVVQLISGLEDDDFVANNGNDDNN